MISNARSDVLLCVKRTCNCDNLRMSIETLPRLALRCRSEPPSRFVRMVVKANTVMLQRSERNILASVPVTAGATVCEERRIPQCKNRCDWSLQTTRGCYRCVSSWL